MAIGAPPDPNDPDSVKRPFPLESLPPKGTKLAMSDSKDRITIAELLIEGMAMGKSVKRLVHELSDFLPSYSTVITFIARDSEFREMYRVGKLATAEVMFDQIMDVINDRSEDWVQIRNRRGELQWRPNHDTAANKRLMVETIKWYTGKVIPRVADGAEVTQPNEPGTIDVRGKDIGSARKLVADRVAGIRERQKSSGVSGGSD